MKEFALSQRSRHNLGGVCPQIQLVVSESIKVCPIDFGIPTDGGVRTAKRQHVMYLDPAIETNCDGYDDISNHQIPEGEQFGKAFDFYAYVNGRASWKEHHLAMIAAVILATAKRLKAEGVIDIDLEWGGTFGSNTFGGWDMPHIQKI